MRVKIRLDEEASLAIAVKEAIIEIYDDGSNKMVGYAEFHSSTPTTNKEVR